MSPSTTVEAAVGTAVRYLATFTIWLILVIAIVVVIDSGLRALRHRQDARRGDQAGDHEALTRSVRVITTPRPGSWGQLADLLPRHGPDRGELENPGGDGAGPGGPGTVRGGS